MDLSKNARSCLGVQEPETAHERNPKRRKVALACTPCRNRKTRCDGARPICSCCRLRRSKLWSSCVYENKNNGTSSEGYQTSDSTQSLLSRIQQLEQRLAVTTNQKDESSQQQDPAGCQPVNLAQEPMSQISETNIQTLSQSPSLSAFTAPDQKVQESSYRYSVSTKNSARDFDATTGSLLDDPFITEPRGVVSGLPRVSTATDSEGRRPGESCQQDQTSTFFTSGRYKFQLGDAQAAQYIRRHDPLYVTQENIMDLACPDAPNQRELSNINAELHSSQELRLGAKSVSPHADSMDAMGIVPITTETPGENRHSYHGQTTTVSFMEELQSTVLPRKTMAANEPLKSNSDRLGPSPHQSAEMLLQLKPAGTCFGDRILPPRHMADHLLQSYWDHVSSLYPFLHRPTFHYAYEQLWVPKPTMENLSQVAEAGIGNSVNAGPSSKLFHCALNAIFALGCQFSEIPVSDRLSISNSFIRRALDLFQVDIMDNGCLSLVQTILLLVQYLQSTTLSNRCWNLIGMACRTSQSLGLHTEDQRTIYQGIGLEVRRRVWYSCLSLDIVFSMTLGRPMMVSDNSIIPLPSSLDHEDSVGPVSPQQQGYVFPKTIFFVEAIKLYRILGNILSSIYQRHSGYSSGRSDGSPDTEKGAFPGHEHFGNTFRLESLLTNFTSNLPPELQWVSGEKFSRTKYTNSAMIEKQRNVLRARYLHLRILLYRPSFTSFCKRSRAGTTVLSISNTIETAADSVQQAFEARCAALCVCAARELVALIHSSSKTPATGAWWYNVFYMYTAGVVITMTFLHNPTEGRINANELKDSWEQCEETLEGLQPRGQSAKQCLDSLQALRSRVSSYKTGQTSELGLSVTKSAGAPGSNKAIDVSDPNENRKAQMSPPNVPRRAGESSLEYEMEGFSYREDLTTQDTGYAESLFDFEEIWVGPTFELFSEAL